MKVIEFWHNGRGAQRPQNIKNCMWEIFVTLKKFFEYFNFDRKYLEKVPPKIFLRFLAKSTKSRMENTNTDENRNRK